MKIKFIVVLISLCSISILNNALGQKYEFPSSYYAEENIDPDVDFGFFGDYYSAENYFDDTTTAALDPKKVYVLNLAYKSISSMPSVFNKLENLERLNLSGNQLTTIPKGFASSLPNLRALTIDNSALSSISELCNLDSLRLLAVFNNKLSDIPHEINKLKQLKVLTLSSGYQYSCSNEFFQIYETIYELEKLESLTINHVTECEISPKIANLKQLKFLDLSQNYINFLPEEIGKMDQLETLVLNNNILKTIPNTIGNLRVKALHLSENQLSSLPETIGNLSNLTKLDLFGNKLKELPEAIGQLSNLKELTLSNNVLSKLPKSIKQLKNLKALYLDGNSISEEDQAIIKSWLPNCSIRF